jgi:hypothetical protein
MASWGSYVFELCRINANQGLTAEIDWNYTSWSRRCRKILIGLVVRGAKTVVVRGKNRILTRNRKKPEMTVPISYTECFNPAYEQRVLRSTWTEILITKTIHPVKYSILFSPNQVLYPASQKTT